MSDGLLEPQSSIPQVDQYLAGWASALLGAVAVSLAPPQTTQPGRGVSFYLYELADRPPPRNTKRPPLQILLRYLVTTWAPEPEEAHLLMDELVFAALENPAFEVELSPVAAETWAALDAVPQPSFVLNVPIRRERPEPETKLVRVPLEVNPAFITDLNGIVMGPGDVPLMGALVELPALQIHTRTDAKGRFRFAAVPLGTDSWHLFVQTKGRRFEVEAEPDGAEEKPLVIRVGPFD